MKPKRLVPTAISIVLALSTATPNEASGTRQDLGATPSVTYELDATTATAAGWARDWTARLGGTSGWTGADGLYTIPMNGNRKLGSAYDTPGWQTFSFNDTLIGTVNEFDQRTDFRFINNSTGIYADTFRSVGDGVIAEDRRTTHTSAY